MATSRARTRSRRRFLSRAGAATAGFMIVPRHVLGRGLQAPSDRLNIAVCGVGGRGRSVITNMVSQNLVAMCDVDWTYTDKGFAGLPKEIGRLEERIADNTVEVRVPASARNQDAPPTITYRPMTPLERARNIAYVERQKTLVEAAPKAARHQDYRRMLEQQKDIDAVVVATPDHLHASIAMAAMDLGKHVYVEKPLCWSVAEARQLAKRAAETKVATQMGNQGHSLDDGRTAVEYLMAGAIGDVREVHVWTNRPLGFWPQGVPRPVAPSTPIDDSRWSGPAITARLGAALTGNYPVPEGLAWDLFLGPGPHVEYHPVYHPFNWRGWVDWGSGPLGDMGAHLIDHAYWALDLGLPTTIETVSTPFNNVAFPHATTTFYEFAARGRQPAVKMTWYDGGLLPPKPVEIGEEVLNPGGGTLVIGSKGKLLYETYGAKPRLLPKSLHDSVGTPPRKLARILDEGHEMNWVDAAKGKTPASSPFEYAAKLTEVMLLGIVSLRAGRKIVYDGAAMRVTNDPTANEFLTRVPREGWSRVAAFGSLAIPGCAE
jgi:predicted dehydrogenase